MLLWIPIVVLWGWCGIIEPLVAFLLSVLGLETIWDVMLDPLVEKVAQALGADPGNGGLGMWLNPSLMLCWIVGAVTLSILVVVVVAILRKSWEGITKYRSRS